MIMDDQVGIVAGELRDVRHSDVVLDGENNNRGWSRSARRHGGPRGAGPVRRTVIRPPTT